MTNVRASSGHPPAGSVEPAHRIHPGGGSELPEAPPLPVMRVSDLNVYYNDFHAVHDVNLAFGRNEITAMIGPSGCGKSTVLRCLNRMNDLVPGARVEGDVTYHDQISLPDALPPCGIARSSENFCVKGFSSPP